MEKTVEMVGIIKKLYEACGVTENSREDKHDRETVENRERNFGRLNKI
jgi:hypothetical protein